MFWHARQGSTMPKLMLHLFFNGLVLGCVPTDGLEISVSFSIVFSATTGCSNAWIAMVPKHLEVNVALCFSVLGCSTVFPGSCSKVGFALFFSVFRRVRWGSKMTSMLILYWFFQWFIASSASPKTYPKAAYRDFYNGFANFFGVPAASNKYSNRSRKINILTASWGYWVLIWFNTLLCWILLFGYNEWL